jgi:hypothetical protein
VAERPAGVVEQRERGFVVAVGVDQAGQMVRRVVGQLGGERDAEEAAQMATVEQSGHVGAEAGDAELGLGPASGGGETRKRELPLGVERIVEVEHQHEIVHAAALAGTCG